MYMYIWRKKQSNGNSIAKRRSLYEWIQRDNSCIMYTDIIIYIITLQHETGALLLSLYYCYKFITCFLYARRRKNLKLKIENKSVGVLDILSSRFSMYLCRNLFFCVLKFTVGRFYINLKQFRIIFSVLLIKCIIHFKTRIKTIKYTRQNGKWLIEKKIVLILCKIYITW